MAEKYDGVDKAELHYNLKKKWLIRSVQSVALVVVGGFASHASSTSIRNTVDQEGGHSFQLSLLIQAPAKQV